MKSQYKLSILISCTIVVMTALAVGRHLLTNSGSVTSVADSTGSQTEMATSPADTTPNAGNVSSQFQAELDALDEWLKEAPDDTTHILRLAILYQDGHQPKKAIPLYEHYLKLHPNNHQAWLDLTSCYGNASEWNKALNTCKRFLTHFPDDPFGLYNIGAIYANMGLTKAARSAWARIITLNTNAHVAAMATRSLHRLDSLGVSTKTSN